jgi:hypothetical protein
MTLSQAEEGKTQQGHSDASGKAWFFHGLLDPVKLRDKDCI